MSEIEITVSMSMATTLSTTVLPMTSRTTPHMMLRKINAPAICRMMSAKDFSQVFLEWPCDHLGCKFRIDGLHIEPMNEQRIVFDRHDQ